jgi:hypothetical protein
VEILIPLIISDAAITLRVNDADSSFASNAAEPHLHPMFVVSESIAETIRRIYQESGEFAAAAELRRHFPGIADNQNARRCARAIAGWSPLPPLPVKKPRKRSSKTRSSTPPEPDR